MKSLFGSRKVEAKSKDKATTPLHWVEPSRVSKVVEVKVWAGADKTIDYLKCWEPVQVVAHRKGEKLVLVLSTALH
jgi:hypothetical protein